MRFITVLATLCLAVSVWIPRALADSWSLPTQQTYVSANGAYRLTVLPRDLSSQLAYFEDEVERRPLPGQEPEGRATPEGRLERRTDAG